MRIFVLGTDRECAAHFGIQLHNIRWYATGVAHRRANEGMDSDRLYAERVDL